MAITVRRQIVASTHADALGDRLTPEMLRELFSQLPEESVQTTNHDLSKPPICRGYNKRLERLPDGELALKLDIDVFDEEAFESMGGFSIAFTRLTIRRGDGEPAIQVLLNPAQFDFRGAAAAIGSLGPPGVTIDVTERIEKAEWVTVAIVVVVINAAMEVAKGFLSAAGGELFRCLKGLRRRDRTGGPTQIQLHVEGVGGGAKVILEITQGVTASDIANLDLQHLSDFFSSLRESQSSDRVVGKLLPGPKVRLEFAVDLKGRVEPMTHQPEIRADGAKED